MQLAKPLALKPGGTIGIFTPSWPGHCSQREKFEYALKQVETLGYKTKLGQITQQYCRQGYRTADGKIRARELMELLLDPDVDAVIATLGGSVTNSLLEHLDFVAIREACKPIIGHSDITSLLLAVHEKARLVCFYGPMLVPSLGEHPRPLDLSLSSFLRAVSDFNAAPHSLEVPKQWSNQSREASSADWNKGQREYLPNKGWSTLSSGEGRGLSLAANLNTLCNCLGTGYVPSFDGRILFLEQLEMDLQKEERQLSQLKLAGVFDTISGLVVSKPEIYESAGAEFGGEELYQEIIGSRDYPIVWGFDCGHTHPSHTIPLGTQFLVRATDREVDIQILEPAVASSAP